MRITFLSNKTTIQTRIEDGYKAPDSRLIFSTSCTTVCVVLLLINYTLDIVNDFFLRNVPQSQPALKMEKVEGCCRGRFITTQISPSVTRPVVDHLFSGYAAIGKMCDIFPFISYLASEEGVPSPLVF